MEWFKREEQKHMFKFVRYKDFNIRRITKKSITILPGVHSYDQ